LSDWYVSSAAYAAIPQFAASHFYAVGNIIRPLTAPSAGQEYTFRCTTAGTSSTEPTAWPSNDGGTVSSGGATFTNVSGQSAYGWGGCAGSLVAIGNRLIANDRVFLSSDHSETYNASGNITYAFGASRGFWLIQMISVNRAGSVPPVSTDAQSGAAITINTFTAFTITFGALVNMYWQGITFTLGGTGGSTLNFNVTGNINTMTLKGHYFKNCAFVLSTTSAAARLTTTNPAKVTFDNTTVKFGNVGQYIGSTAIMSLDLTWINTPAAIQGPTIPNALFNFSTNGHTNIICRGVDLSAITGALLGMATANSAMNKVLLDSCKLAPNVVRLATPAAGNGVSDEVELINCFDGTNVLTERYTGAGSVVTDRTNYQSLGAQDDLSNFSLKLTSSARCDKYAYPLDSFWLDIENTSIGASKTATVEIVSATTLYNDEISLLLEYMGTSGSQVASFASSLPPMLTTPSTLTSSSATWANPPGSGWNPADINSMTLSAGNLTATSTAGSGGVRGVSYASGKFYWECAMATWANANTAPGIASASAILSNFGATPTQAALVRQNGLIWVNNVSTGNSLGARASGDVIGIALDIGSRLIWFRLAPSGNWNGSSTANPATGTGGLNISGLLGALYPAFAGAASGDQCSINVGGSSFVGSVPSGFTSGLPIPGPAKLQVAFTPRVAGRVRGLIKLGKTNTIVWVNPQMAT
jgi:hypothetical protein